MGDVWRYDDRRTVVTGCASGIGAATARELCALGATVVGVDVAEPTQEVAEFHRVDLADPGSIDAAIGPLGAIDALFNCAGLSNGAAEPEQVFRVNFLGLRRLTEALLPSMGSGAAVASVASLGGQGWEANLEHLEELCATPGFDEGFAWFLAHPDLWEGGAYGVSKQAVIVYSKWRCVELAQRGIRTNTIGPGVTQTPMLVASARSLGGDAALDRVPAPLGRRAEPEEQARVLVFLAGDAASYVTGQHLWTDAGFMGGLEVGTLGALRLRD
jgi:NAD(P)-dependent dehydrogenase (short-subunit alcohol dehydrogenase family)